VTRLGALALLAALVLACGREDGKEGVKPTAEASVPGVETVVAAVQPVRDVVEAFATVAPAGEPPEVRDARSDLAAAEARRGLAAQQVRRLEVLAQGGVAPRKELDAARAEEASAAAAAVRARQVLAAFGSGADPRPLAADETWVVARVLQGDVSRVQAGAEARLVADAAPGRPFPGQVDAAPAYVDPTTRLAPLRVRLRDPEHALRPGMTGGLAIEVGAPRSAVVVPAAAVVLDGARPFVFVEDGAGHFAPQPVRVGVARDGSVEIADGLAAGARVVTTGAASLLSATRLPAGGQD
jgi:hypothetical protein